MQLCRLQQTFRDCVFPAVCQLAVCDLSLRQVFAVFGPPSASTLLAFVMCRKKLIKKAGIPVHVKMAAVSRPRLKVLL